MAKLGGYSLGGVGALGRHYYRSPSFSRPWRGGALSGLAGIGQDALAIVKSIASVDGARKAGGIVLGRAAAGVARAAVQKAVGSSLPADGIAKDAVNVVVDVLTGVVLHEALRRVPGSGALSEFALYGAATRTLSNKVDNVLNTSVLPADLQIAGIGEDDDISGLIAALAEDDDALSGLVLPADSQLQDVGGVILPDNANIAEVVLPAEYGISATEDSLF